MNPMLSEEQVKHLISLAMLEPKPEELSSLQKNLEQMLSYVDCLNTLDGEEPDTSASSLILASTKQIASMKQIASIKQVSSMEQEASSLRIDEVKGYPSPEAFVSLAPKQKDGCYLVPSPFTMKK